MPSLLNPYVFEQSTYSTLRFYIYEEGGSTYLTAKGGVTFTGGVIGQNDFSVAGPGFLRYDVPSDGGEDYLVLACAAGFQYSEALILSPLALISFPIPGASPPDVIIPYGLFASSSSGDNVNLGIVLNQDPNLNFSVLALPLDYTSGSPVNSTSIFPGDFADNGIIPPPVAPTLIGSFQCEGGGIIEVWFDTPPS